MVVSLECLENKYTQKCCYLYNKHEELEGERTIFAQSVRLTTRTKC